MSVIRPIGQSNNYHMFIIGRRWRNQYGHGIKTMTLISATNPPARLPKGYTLCGKTGTVKQRGKRS